MPKAKPKDTDAKAPDAPAEISPKARAQSNAAMPHLMAPAGTGTHPDVEEALAALDAKDVSRETPPPPNAGDGRPTAKQPPDSVLPDVVTLPDGRLLLRTTRGLPNTCCETGEPCGTEENPTWFAANDDAARAGQGSSEAWVRAQLAGVS